MDVPLVFCSLGPLAVAACWAEASRADQLLVDLTSEAALARLRPTAPDQVSVTRTPGAPGLVVTCRPGAQQHVGVILAPEPGTWDLSACGYVVARIVNTGAVTNCVALRVDNGEELAGNQFNAETLTLEPGEAGTVRVLFGFSFGTPGFALDASRVSRVLAVVGPAGHEQSFRLESLAAGGDPGQRPQGDPSRVALRPPDGVLLGPGAAVDASRQLIALGGAAADVTDAAGTPSLRVTLPAGASDATVVFKPAAGLWDLRDWLQVAVHARNEGRGPVVLQARLESTGWTGPWVVASAPLAPGEEQELVIPFAQDVAILDAVQPPRMACPGFESDCASGVTISASGDGDRLLRVDRVRAAVPPPPTLPGWLGRHPPVPGDWIQTLAEDFDGPELDSAKWSPRFPNYWGGGMHFSKDNVTLAEGKLRLRFERRMGHHNDDPAQPETELATGTITSQGRWRQRYGYFEARLKLPRAPGMWHGCFLMPDRGPGAEWSGTTTTDGGMEFDILEYFTRYGPYRFNVGCLWDGYLENGKVLAFPTVYVRPDAQGFITAGLMWEPGRVTFYRNGAPVAQWTNPRVGSVSSYLLVTAHTNSIGGNALTGEGLPDDFVIDYVRAWQRRDWVEDQG